MQKQKKVTGDPTKALPQTTKAPTNELVKPDVSSVLGNLETAIDTGRKAQAQKKAQDVIDKNLEKSKRALERQEKLIAKSNQRRGCGCW